MLPVPGLKFHWHKAYGKSDVPSVARSVAYVVWDYTGADGEHGFPGTDILMASTNLSESQVRRNLKVNVDAGWLELVKCGSRTQKRAWKSEYRLTYPADHRSPMTDGELSVETDHPSPMTAGRDDRRSPMHGPPVTRDTPTDPLPNPSLLTDPYVKSSNPEGRDSADAGRDGSEIDRLKKMRIERMTEKQIEMLRAADYEWNDWDDSWYLPKF